MIASIVRTGWLNLRRDRGALILSFVVPVVFFTIFASIFTAQRNQTPAVKLAVADEDHSPRSRELIDALRRETALKLITTPKAGAPAFDPKTAEAFVRGGSAPVALVIPKGFGSWRLAFGSQSSQPAFQLLTDAADPIAPQLVEGLLQKTMMTSLPEVMIDGGVEALDRWSGGFTPEQRAAIDSSVQTLQQRRATGTGTGSTGSFIRIEKKDLLGENKKEHSLVSLFAAGIGVMFLLFTATNAGGALIEENESGTLDRILTTRVSFGTLLAGKLVYLWTLGFAQITVMFIWAAVAFKLDLMGHLGGFVIIAAATTLATSAFGLLLASVCQTRAQLSAISTLVVLSISALGGSMFPRFLMPESIQKASLVLFNSWALEGFTNVFWRELPLSSLAVPVLVLTGCAAVFFAVSRQLTKRWEVS